MDADTRKNVVVFEAEGLEPYVGDGPTRDDDCIQQVWAGAPAALKNVARKVVRVVSEWEPSKLDSEFIRRTFPKAEVSYNFKRPRADAWDAAFIAAQRQLLEQSSGSELLPILWSQSSPIIGTLSMLPHLTLLPGHLYLSLATVAPTPEGRVGVSHVTNAALKGSFEAAVEKAFAQLIPGLKVEGVVEPDRSGEMATLRRQGPYASSVVAMPNFYAEMCTILRADRLLVGLPDPDNVLVTPMDSGWAEEVRSAVLNSRCEAQELTPSLFELENGGLVLVAERPTQR